MGKTERFIDPYSANSTGRIAKEASTLFGDLYVDRSDMTKWDAQVAVYLNKSFGGHNLNVSTTFNAMSTTSEYTSSHYRGFPSGEFHAPNFAAEIYLKPTRTTDTRRLVGWPVFCF